MKTAACSVILDSSSEKHTIPNHPECPARLVRAYSGIPAGIPRHEAAPASAEDIHRIHDPDYTEMLMTACSTLQSPVYLDADTYITSHSYDIARNAAGAAVFAVDRSFAGEHCFALVRPPGHHAEHNRAMGFCLLNNIAIAAAYALTRVPKVAIIDWDVHHGNGTQHSFYGTDKLLYCSVHQEFFYPYSGTVTETGIGAGEGYTINAPLPPGSTIADYSAVFREIFLPAIRRFNPSVLLVSAGQDILFDDPQGGMKIMPEDFGILTGMVKSAVECPLTLVLEGGYGPSIGAAISSIFSALMNDAEHAPVLDPSRQTQDIIQCLKDLHHLIV